MDITYISLWKILIDKEMNKTQLKEAVGVSSNFIAKMGKNEPVAIEMLMKIAIALVVDISEIIGSE
ncbi:helix-turn-helix transcriptional regulator [Proteiniclasticum sp. BAD-10]|uniref:Helix-turn-helix transcriptional regulator n=1 Tax=Proteiniclasticum sediminis TaxID=2804028 RepID=A0A941CPZ1_9CLOT|nr:helix-turn-helix transcriptional regulator [Proteiniclasticum sediminis]MBR0576107.1 helix-turn-helix transcriptional regulator [Proteiniclasticum sediminis]